MAHQFLVNKDFNPAFNALKSAIKEKDIKKIKEYALISHGLTHTHAVANLAIETYPDYIFADITQLSLDDFSQLLHKNKYEIPRTVAMTIFHMTRIEDMCANILIANREQVFFEDNWQARLNIRMIDTGNSWTSNEVEEFSTTIDIEELFNYRNAVGVRTQQIIQALELSDIKRKVAKDDLNRLVESGSVLTREDSIWLTDYWGKKDVAGLLLMPLTRHNLLHLSECRNSIGKRK